MIETYLNIVQPQLLSSMGRESQLAFNVDTCARLYVALTSSARTTNMVPARVASDVGSLAHDVLAFVVGANGSAQRARIESRLNELFPEPISDGDAAVYMGVGISLYHLWAGDDTTDDGRSWVARAAVDSLLSHEDALPLEVDPEDAEFVSSRVQSPSIDALDELAVSEIATQLRVLDALERDPSCALSLVTASLALVQSCVLAGR